MNWRKSERSRSVTPSGETGIDSQPCHPEAAGAAIRNRAFAPRLHGGGGRRRISAAMHMPEDAHLEILRRPAAPRNICARFASSAGASGRLRMTPLFLPRAQSFHVIPSGEAVRVPAIVRVQPRCHPETAGAAIRARAFALRPHGGGGRRRISSYDANGMCAATGDPSPSCAAWNICARFASSAGASGCLRMTQHFLRRASSNGDLALRGRHRS
jgi:hypothetical protein